MNLSLNQQRYLFAELTTQANYDLPISYQLTGDLDRLKLIACIQKVVDANEILRIRLWQDASGNVIQEVSSNYQVKLDYVQLEQSTASDIKHIINAHFFKKENILNSELLKFQLISINPKEHIFTFSIHHLLADGITLALFTQQLSQAWSSTLDTTTRKIYDLACNDHLVGEHKEFWKVYLAGASAVKMPRDFATSAAESYQKKEISQAIDANLVARVADLAKLLGVSQFNIFYAVYLILISRYCGEDDICTTFQSSGRQHLDNADDVMGLFSRALILRQKLSENLTVDELARSLRAQVRNCIQHQQYPYHYIIRDCGVQPKYAINWYPVHEVPVLHGLICERVNYVGWQSDFDLNLHCVQSKGEIHLVPHFDPQVLSSARVEIMFRQFESVLRQLVEEPSIKLSDISLTVSANQLPLPDFTSGMPPRIDGSIFGNFLHQAQIHPHNIAIHFQNEQWSYQEVDEISTRLALLLINRGVKKESKVAILGLRCASIVLSMIAVSRAGAAFVVFDAAYPATRLQCYADIISPDFIISCGDNPVLDELDVRCNSLSVSDSLKLSEIEPVMSDTPEIATSQEASSIAYYLFTSGTTRLPKCIATSHAPLAHFTHWQIQNFSITHQDRVTMLSGIGHDPVLRDVFTTLSAGACVLIPTQDTIFDHNRLFSWLHSTRATICHLTPPLSQIIYAGFKNDHALDEIRFLFTGGDALQKSHIVNMKVFAPNASIVNFYGATETPQAMAYFELPIIESEEVIPIGKSVSDIQVLILNDQLKLAGCYEVGQVVIRSKYLSEGYLSPQGVLGDVSLDSPFKSDLFTDDNDVRIYLTGDYGYYRSDGNVVLKGRLDDQVKIRGFRIELSEISGHLKSIVGISDAITLLVAEADGMSEKKLVAYLVKNQQSNLGFNKVKQVLAKELPSYMLPSYFVWVDSLPLLPNGKIDRTKLPPPSHADSAYTSQTYLAPENEIESAITHAWSKILGMSNLSTLDTFATLGGDSLSYIQASLALEKAIGYIPDGWNEMTIKELSRLQGNNGLLVNVHTSVLVRAISITMVVIEHFWVAKFTGATSALFIIAGYTFANFQLKAIDYKKSVRPILNTVLSIALPTTFMTLVHVIFRQHIDFGQLFLVNNFFVKYSTYWFIEVLVQILLFMAVLLNVKRIRGFVLEKSFQASFYFLIFSSVLALLAPSVCTTHLLDTVPHMKLWFFAFGACVFFSVTKYQKLLVSFMSILLPFIVLGHASFITTLTVILLIYIPNVKLINPLHKLVYMVAAASLFIYLTHFQFRSVLHAVGLNISPQMDALIGLLGGVMVWRAWETGITYIKKFKTECRFANKIV